jgi:hypothetical protein
VVPLLDGQLDIMLPKQLGTADNKVTLSRRGGFNSECPALMVYQKTGAGSSVNSSRSDGTKQQVSLCHFDHLQRMMRPTWCAPQDAGALLLVQEVKRCLLRLERSERGMQWVERESSGRCTLCSRWEALL